MNEEVFKKLCEKLLKDCEGILDFFRKLSRLFDKGPVLSPFWKPYHCRTCGRRYTTPMEVRLCTRRHPKWKASGFTAGRAYEKCTGAHVAPRNRESAMRPTEIRRYKRAEGG